VRAEPERPVDWSSRCDVVFDAAGTDAALATALESARPGGVIVVVGIPPADTTRIAASTARRKELTLRWSRRMATGDLARAAALASSRTDQLLGLVTHRHSLGDIGNAFCDLVARRGIKVLVTPGNDQ
jgi:L-iditol 2-dehydrogenase